MKEMSQKIFSILIISETTHQATSLPNQHPISQSTGWAKPRGQTGAKIREKEGERKSKRAIREECRGKLIQKEGKRKQKRKSSWRRCHFPTALLLPPSPSSVFHPVVCVLSELTALPSSLLHTKASNQLAEKDTLSDQKSTKVGQTQTRKES